MKEEELEDEINFWKDFINFLTFQELYFLRLKGLL